MSSHLKSRLAQLSDIGQIRNLMDLSISNLQKDFLSDEQIKASYDVMGLDSQLIEDGAYYVILDQDIIVGCGGWSRRATLSGEPLYQAAGYQAIEPFQENTPSGIKVPLIRMGKKL